MVEEGTRFVNCRFVFDRGRLRRNCVFSDMSAVIAAGAQAGVNPVSALHLSFINAHDWTQVCQEQGRQYRGCWL